MSQNQVHITWDGYQNARTQNAQSLRITEVLVDTCR